MRAPIVPGIAVALALGMGASEAASVEPADLWQWQNPASIVAVVEIDADGPRGTMLARAVRVFLGELDPRDRIALDVREANRERPAGVEALDVRDGRRYLALLEPADRQPRRLDFPLYRIVRGVEGIRSLPGEGSEAWIDALSRITAIRGLGRDELVWEGLGALLLDRNPLLVRTALEAHVSFERGGPEILPAVRELLRNARPDVRSLASSLAGICLRRADEARGEEAVRETTLALVAIARTDEVPEVRASAVRALGSRFDASTRRVLEEVADKDPEQEVRYEARRVLYERAHGPSGD